MAPTFQWAPRIAKLVSKRLGTFEFSFGKILASLGKIWGKPQNMLNSLKMFRKSIKQIRCNSTDAALLNVFLKVKVKLRFSAPSAGIAEIAKR